ncbi:hypothetical protein PFDG_05023, partial [Plasmodium falciparum Dd2]
MIIELIIIQNSSFLNNEDPELLCDNLSGEEGQKNKYDMIFGHDEGDISSLDNHIDIKEHSKLMRISSTMQIINNSNDNNKENVKQHYNFLYNHPLHPVHTNCNNIAQPAEKATKRGKYRGGKAGFLR